MSDKPTLKQRAAAGEEESLGSGFFGGGGGAARFQTDIADAQRWLDVTEAMMRAGARNESRIAAGVRAWYQQRKKRGSPKRGGTKVGGILRFMGKPQAAIWIDRFFGKYNATGRQLRGGARIPAGGADMGTGGGGRTSVSDSRISGNLMGIKVRLGVLSQGMADIADDVSDIKSLLLPKDITVKGRKGKKVYGDWRDLATANYKHKPLPPEKTINLRYDPLAPASEQFKIITKTGKLTSKSPDQGFINAATKNAALATATLALKIQKKDEEKAVLRKKHVYRDPKETDPLVADDPLLLLRADMNANFKKILDRLDGIKKGSDGLIDTLGDWGGMIAGISALAPYAQKLMKLGSALRWIFNLPLVAAALATYGIYKAIDKGFSIETNIDQTNKLFKKNKLPFEQFKDTDGTIKLRIKDAKGNEQIYKMDDLPNEYRRAFDYARFRHGNKESMNKVIKDLNTTGIKTTPRKMSREEAIKAEKRLKQNTTGSLMTKPMSNDAKNIPPEGLAFLDALSIPESGGRYDTIVGSGKYGAPATFSDFSKHPGIAGVGLTKTGKWTRVDSPDKEDFSTAAGRYQITRSTWKRLQMKYGFTDFKPETQDLAAWNLAKDDYAKKTGKNLLDELRQGNFYHITKHLNKTWTSLAGGIEERDLGNIVATQERYNQALPVRIAQNNQGIIPATTMFGNRIDGDSRELMATNTGRASGSTIVPVSIDASTQHNTMGRHPAPKASTVSDDPSFIRIAGRDVPHPVFVG